MGTAARKFPRSGRIETQGMHTSTSHHSLFAPSASRLGIVLAAVLLFVVTVGAGPPAALEERFDQLLQAEELSNTFWGIDIRYVDNGQQLYGYNAQKLLLPASTNKLLTSATALDALGSTYRYRTTLYYDGEVTSSGTLKGNLIIVGSGDPTFGSSAMSNPGEKASEDPLRKWAQQLDQMGITQIEGRIIGVDDTFSDVPYAEGWDIDYLTDQASSWLGISTSGLSYNDNIIRIRVRAGEVNDEPHVVTQPAGYVNSRNEATTRPVSRGATLKLTRNLSSLDAETFSLEGWISRGYEGTFEKPVHNPTLFTVHAFRKHLQDAGVNVSASVHDIDDLSQKPDLENIRPLLVHFSAPLVEILRVMNHESNNFYAEQVFRTFSPDGSLEGASNRVKALLRRTGAATENLSIRDGSGLSRKDLISPIALSKLLAYMLQHPSSEAYRSTIAKGGDVESTLRYRLRGLPVQAKTGSLAYVRALSGYAETSDGRTVAFTLFANNYRAPSYLVSQTLDRIVVALTSIPVS